MQELERVVKKCLTKEPGKRYQHMDEITVDLQLILMTLILEADGYIVPMEEASEVLFGLQSQLLW